MSIVIIGLIVIVGLIAALLLADTCARRFTKTHDDLGGGNPGYAPFERSDD
jgi:hypothetical protein